MTEKLIYFELAERYFNSGFRENNSDLPNLEVVAFKYYHAYESLASAVMKYYGRVIPISHAKKLNTFLALSKKNTNQINEHNVAYITMMLANQRNRFLYPEIEATGIMKAPKEQVNEQIVNKIKNHVSGVINATRPIM